MTNDLTNRNSTTERSLPLTGSIAKALDDQGTEVQPVEWSPPESISSELEEDARLFAKAFSVQSAKRDANRRKVWILRLMLCWPLNFTEADAKTKSELYANMLSDYPDYLFTDQSLRAANKEMKWFPSVHELAQWLEAALIADQIKAQRCMKILDKADADRRSGQERKRSDREGPWRGKDHHKHPIPEKTHEQKLAEIRAEKRKYGFGPETDVRDQLPGESAADYMRFCKEIIMRNLADGEKLATKRRNENKPFWHAGKSGGKQK